MQGTVLLNYGHVDFSGANTASVLYKQAFVQLSTSLMSVDFSLSPSVYKMSQMSVTVFQSLMQLQMSCFILNNSPLSENNMIQITSFYLFMIPIPICDL